MQSYQDIVTKEYANGNPLNDLKDRWNNSEDYSSWCRINYTDPIDVAKVTAANAKIAKTGTKAVKPAVVIPHVEMAQANYFLRVNFPSDTEKVWQREMGR
eukprot:gene34618-42706_t